MPGRLRRSQLTGSPRTIQRWATKLRHGRWPLEPRTRGRRPPTRAELIELVLILKDEDLGCI
jgi:hypothetical protein